MDKFETNCVLAIGGINLRPFLRITLLHKRNPASSTDISISLCKILVVKIMSIPKRVDSKD